LQPTPLAEDVKQLFWHAGMVATTWSTASAAATASSSDTVAKRTSMVDKTGSMKTIEIYGQGPEMDLKMVFVSKFNCPESYHICS
jgi:hypothetical protein